MLLAEINAQCDEKHKSLLTIGKNYPTRMSYWHWQEQGTLLFSSLLKNYATKMPWIIYIYLNPFTICFNCILTDLDENRKNPTIFDLWATWFWTVQVHLYEGFFNKSVCMVSVCSLPYNFLNDNFWLNLLQENSM